MSSASKHETHVKQHTWTSTTIRGTNALRRWTHASPHNGPLTASHMNIHQVHLRPRVNRWEFVSRTAASATWVWSATEVGGYSVDASTGKVTSLPILFRYGRWNAGTGGRRRSDGEQTPKGNDSARGDPQELYRNIRPIGASFYPNWSDHGHMLSGPMTTT